MNRVTRLEHSHVAFQELKHNCRTRLSRTCFSVNNSTFSFFVMLIEVLHTHYVSDILELLPVIKYYYISKTPLEMLLVSGFLKSTEQTLKIFSKVQLCCSYAFPIARKYIYLRQYMMFVVLSFCKTYIKIRKCWFPFVGLDMMEICLFCRKCSCYPWKWGAKAFRNGSFGKTSDDLLKLLTSSRFKLSTSRRERPCMSG